MSPHGHPGLLLSVETQKHRLSHTADESNYFVKEMFGVPWEKKTCYTISRRAPRGVVHTPVVLRE